VSELTEAAAYIEALELEPHPEGGYYREIYRSPQAVQAGPRHRSAGTSIYYLLPEDSFSAWHVVASDEQWHHYAGATLELHLLRNGATESIRLGGDLLEGEFAQAVVPAGVVQAAQPIGGWALMGCTVVPGFDFQDFRMNSAAELKRDFPGQEEIIDRFCRRDRI
jgi:predicted cupin superfamily sugar epimerase